METIGTVTDAYRDGNDVVLTVVRNPDIPYRLWKETMDLIERTAMEMEDDMECHKCGKKGNFTVHLKETRNGKMCWKPVYMCGPCMSVFVAREMHQQRAKA